ncbi:MAG TPA: hypothetical protein VMU48_07180 [Terracidiphilus sp.]|nr:hypothetical protein [Terracidiphilus sp.]
MQDALSALETSYFTLQAQIAELSAACQTPDQINALMSKYVAIRANYWSCINKAFHDDDPSVTSLVAKLNAANTNLKSAVEQMGDMNKVLDFITQAVTLGTSLATKVISI